MRDRHSCLSWVATLLLALPLAAQSPDAVWWIEVASQQDTVMSGRTLELDVYATNAYGAAILGFSPQWRSSNPMVAEVDGAGRVRGLLPGRALIEAFSGEVSGAFSVRVIPGRVEIQPEEFDLDIGQQTALAARALDADGNPIPGARFVWHSGVPQVATVDGTGMVTGRTGGTVTLTALLDAGEPGFGFSAQARARVYPRRDFRIARLVSNELTSRGVTLKSIEQVAYGGDRIGLIGSLSNGGQALMSIDNGVLRVLALAGEYSEAIGRVVNVLGGVSVNARGDLLAQVGPWFDRWRMFLYRGPAGTTPEVIQYPDEYGGVQIHLRSLGDNGDIAFFGWNNRGQNALLRRADGRIERIATQRDTLPGLAGWEQTGWFNEIALGAAGSVVFNADACCGRYGFYQWDGTQIRKIFATGDAVLGRTVRWGSMPIQALSGDLYARMGFDDYQHIARLSGGAWTNVAFGGQTLSNGVTFHWSDVLWDVREGGVLVSGGSDRGNGLFRLEGGNLELVARYGGSAENGEWRWFERAYLTRTGAPIALGAQGNSISRLVRLEGAAGPLAWSGQSLSVDAPPAVDWNWPYTGGVFRTQANAFFRARPNALEPIAARGDIMPDGSLLGWTGAFATNRNGELAFQGGTTRGQSVFLWRNGRLLTVAEQSERYKGPGGTNIHWFQGPIAVNNLGQVVVSTGYDGGQGLLLFTEGSTASRAVVALGAAAPGGGTFSYVRRAAIDEGGRVLFAADVAGGTTSLFLWENGVARRLRQYGDAGPGGLRLAEFQDLRAAGDKLLALFRFGNWQAFEIWEYSAGGAARLAVPSSAPGLCGDGFFSAASNGDILYRTCGGRSFVVQKTDGRTATVADVTQRSSGGDWFLNLMGAVLNEQGDVLFTAVSPAGLRDRIGLYQATPQ